MTRTRLARLATLTQGVALLSSLGAGCDRSQSGETTPPPMQPAINATASPPAPQASAPEPPASAPAPQTSAPAPGDPARADPVAANGSARTIPTRRLPIPNAPPGRPLWIDTGGDAGPPPRK